MRLPFLRRRTGFIPVVPSTRHPAAQRAASIVNHVLSQWPDLPLHETVEGIHDRIGVVWRVHPEVGRGTTPIHGDDERLHPNVVDAIRHDALRAAACAMRRQAMTDQGLRPEDGVPGWGLLMIEPHAAVVRTSGVDLDICDGGTLKRRLELAFQLRGITQNIERQGFRLVGRVTTPSGGGVPQCSIRADPAAITLHQTTLPETAMAAMPGRRLDDVVSIGGGSPSTIIRDVRMTSGGFSVTLGLDAPWTPIGRPPATADMRWVDALMKLPEYGATTT